MRGNGEQEPGEAPSRVQGRANTRGDPDARSRAGDADRIRGAHHRPAGRGSSDVQERAVRSLPIERGAPARHPPHGWVPHGRERRQAGSHGPARRAPRARSVRALARVGAVAELAGRLPLHGGLVRAGRPARAGPRLRRSEPARLDRHLGRGRAHRGQRGPLPRRSRLRAVRTRLPGDRSRVRACFASDARSQGPRPGQQRLRDPAARLPRLWARYAGSIPRRRLEPPAPLTTGEENRHDRRRIRHDGEKHDRSIVTARPFVAIRQDSPPRALGAPLTARGFSVVTFDAPGHGASDGGTVTIPELTSAIRAVAESRGPLAAVVAHAVGATAAVRALWEGLDAGAVVLVGPAADLVTPALRFSETFGFSREVRERMHRRIEERVGRSWSVFDAIELAPALAAPLLVIHDRGDAEIPWQHGAAI